MKLIETTAGQFRVEFDTPQGKRSLSLAGAKNKKEAEKLCKDAKVEELESAARTTKLNKAVINRLMGGAGISVSVAIDEWWAAMKKEGNLQERTISNNVTFAKAWANKVRVCTVKPGDITADHINRWVNAEDGTKLGTRRVRLSILRGFFDFCSASGWCVGNPARLVRKVNMGKLGHAQKETKKKVPFNPAEEIHLFDYLGTEMRKAGVSFQRKKELGFWTLACVLGRDTGLRLGDICQLERDCINTTTMELTVWTDKRDKRVQLPMSDSMKAFLPECVKTMKGEYIFDAECRMLRSKNRAQLSNQFARILQACSITGKSFHCWRYTYIAKCEADGVSMPHIAERVGHSSTKTTELYASAGRVIKTKPLLVMPPGWASIHKRPAVPLPVGKPKTVAAPEPPKVEGLSDAELDSVLG